MQTHVIRYNVWQADNSFLPYFLVWDGDDVYQVSAASPKQEANMRRQYPTRIEHPGVLSCHRGRVEADTEVYRLRVGWPEFFKALSRKVSFEDHEPSQRAKVLSRVAMPLNAVLEEHAGSMLDPRERFVMMQYVALGEIIKGWSKS